MIDRILYNGNIITLNESERVSALAIRGAEIVAVGADDAILALATADTIKENLKGQTVIPGLTDAHIHWLWTAQSAQMVNLFDVPTNEAALALVAARIATVSGGDWVRGFGWSQALWPGQQFPSAADLDSVSPNNPVCLQARSGHLVWANSRAMRLCGITADTADPDGGQIGRDESGQPNGLFFETAMDLIVERIPKPKVEQVAEWMKVAQESALAVGLTGCHDMDGPDCFQALQLLHSRGELALRFVKNINDYWIDHAYAMGLRWGYGDDWLRIGGLKMFVDGALGPKSALMIEPFEGEPDNTGIAVKSKEELIEEINKASSAGVPSTIHAIGDMAVHNVLDAYAVVRQEEARRGQSPEMMRHRIEHLQLIHPDDAHRLAELQIIASMQPIHATSDYPMADAYWGERSKGAYNPRTQIDHGVVVAFGSDSPVEPFNPLAGIHAAVTRRRADGSPGEDGWYPDARLTVDEALRGFTIGPAYAAGMEDRLGKLAPGYLADLVVLDRDLYTIPAGEILDIKVIGTMVGGKWRFGGV